MSDLIGTTLGKYDIRSRLGQGGMADVYRAYQPGLDRHVAIKVLHGHLAHEADFISRFKREAAMVARLRHPNIVQAHDFDVDDDRYFMVMELIEGITLNVELRERARKNSPFSLIEITQIFSALTGAVDYAHVRGMIHRDLKPSNIMFTTEGQVVLTDFGISHIMGSTHYTAADMVVGTPTYMAPEQGRGGQVDARSDIYALGIILYELATGQTPFQADTPIAMIMQHVSEAPPRPSAIKPGIPATVEQVILKAISKEPADRYQKAAEMGRSLLTAVEQATDETVVSAGPIFALTPSLQRDIETVVSADANGTVVSPAASPYRGLFAFREEDAPFFFGREDFTNHLLEAVDQQSMIAVIGPSGSGKSSVVFAGLVARLRQTASSANEDDLSPPERREAETQIQNRKSKIQNPTWLILHFRPGSQPFQSLANALLPWLETELSETDRLVETRKLAAALRQADLGLTEVMDRLLAKQSSPSKLLLVTDQFEELFTLCPAAETRSRFLDLLMESVDIQRFRSEPDFTFVLTLRADFLGQALSHRAFADALQHADMKLGPMNRQELARAIGRPAQKQGVSFESGLIARILDDVGDEPGNLPLLEFALTTLWDRQFDRQLTHAAYAEIGRVEGSLARHAETIYEDLAEAEQDSARRVIIQMVRPGEGTEDTRRLATRSELGEEDWDLVQRLADARLVVTARDPAGQETVEVVHEALIRGWERLRDWMSADRTFRAWQERLRAALRQWEASGQDDGALLRGAPLAEAESWLAERERQLGQLEREYIQQGMALHQQEIESARHQADLERQRAEQLRRRAVYLTGALLLAIVAVIVAALFANRAQSSATAEIKARQTAVADADARATAVASGLERETEARRQSRIALAQSLVAQADRVKLLTNEDDLAILLTLEALTINDEARGKAEFLIDVALRDTLSTPYFNTTLFTGFTANASLESVAFSPDGQMLAAGTNGRMVLLWDLTDPGSQPRIFASDSNYPGIESVSFSPDSQMLAAGSGEDIFIWDLTDAEAEPRILRGLEAVIRSMAFSPDGELLASGALDGSVRLWGIGDVQTGRRILSGHDDSVSAIAFSPDGRTLASAGVDKTILLRDLNDKDTAARVLDVDDRLISFLKFSSDGQALISGGIDSALLWDLTDLGSKPRTIGSGAFNYDSDFQRLMVSGFSNSITFQDFADLEAEPVVLDAPNDEIQAVALSPNGRTVATAGTRLRIWNLAESESGLRVLRGPIAPSHISAISADRQFLASGRYTKTLSLWDLNKPEAEPRKFVGHEEDIAAVAFSPNGRILASRDLAGTILLWDLDKPADQPRPLSGQSSGIMQRTISLLFSPDGQTLASANLDGTVQLWDVADLEAQPRVLDVDIVKGRQGRRQLILAFSPDGQTLVAGVDGTVSMLNLDDPKAEPRYFTAVGSVENLLFSPDGLFLAAGSYDTIQLWDLENPNFTKQILTGHDEDVTTLDFSPDGRLLASGSADQTVRLWNLTQPGSEPRIFKHDAEIGIVAFSPDSQTLISALSNRSQVWLWQPELESLRAIACQTVRRNLTGTEWERYLPGEPYRQSCPKLPGDASSRNVARYLRRLDPSPCPFVVAKGEGISCNTLVVPEDRSRPNSPTIEVALAVLVNTSGVFGDNPLFYIPADPGARTLGSINLWRRHPLRRTHDIILMDRRGTGNSMPKLACPEFSGLGYFTPNANLPPAEDVAQKAEEAIRCRDRLRSQNINLATYNLTATAADINDFMGLSRFEQVNLYATGYGTRLALTTMRDYPEIVRGAFLDSVVPLQANLFEESAANSDRGIRVLFERCAADLACRRTYPDLERVFFDTVADYTADPVRLTIPDPVTGEPSGQAFDGDMLIAGLRQALMSDNLFSILPITIYQLQARNQDVLQSMARQLIEGSDYINMGAYFSDICNHSANFEDPGKIEASLEAYPYLRGVNQRNPDLTICESWGAGQARQIEHEPLISDIPALIFSGEHDPLTALSWGQTVAQSLDNSFYYQIPGTGYVASFGPCQRSIIGDFLENPSDEPNTSCIADMTRPEFVTDVYINGGVFRLATDLLQEQKPVPIALFGVSVLLLLSAVIVWPLGYIVVRLRRQYVKLGRSARWARWLAAAVALLNLAFSGALGYVIWGTFNTNPFTLLFGVPSYAAPLFILPWLSAVLTVGLIAFTVVAWKDGYWGKVGRVHYLLVTLGAIGFSGFMIFWGIL